MSVVKLTIFFLNVERFVIRFLDKNLIVGVFTSINENEIGFHK